MIFPQNFEQKTGFDKIRNLIKDLCLSDLGKTSVDKMYFSIDYNHILRELMYVDEFKLILEKDNFPISYFFDMRQSISRLKTIDTYLTIEEVFDLKRSLSTLKSILNFFRNDKENMYPNLKKLASEVKFFSYVTERIDKVMDKNGEIRDNASPELANIRASLAKKQSSVSSVINKILKNARSQGIIEKDTNITVRDGKMLIPVPAAYKRKIKGYVHDESATGKTAYIEPLEAIELNNEIRELEFAERREIIKILTKLSDDIRPYAEDLAFSYDFMAKIDFIRAKTLFAKKINASVPSLSDKKIFDYRYAIHPLLYLNFKEENRKVVPVDIELNENQRIIVISGPNAGGKSVTLKTLGLLQYMLQCGLAIPVKETSTIGIFDKIFIDIGDEQSIENDLSTYSSHLINMKFFIENSDENTLILIDEFGTGTEPALGGAIAETILEELNNKNVFGLITTHYTNLKHFATTHDGVENAAMLFDQKQMKPLFMLEIGKPGRSFALEIAEKIGLNKNIIEKAKNKIGHQHIDFERIIQEAEEDRRKLINDKKYIEQLKKRLEKQIEQYTKDHEEILKQRKQIITLAKQQAEKIIESSNKIIENTIFEIKKAQADKEKTKEIRRKLKDKQKEQTKNLELHEKAIEEKINKIVQRRENKKEKKLKTQKQSQKNQTININDSVRIKENNAIGQVLEIKDGVALVSIGNFTSFVKLERLEKISNNQIKKQNKKQKTDSQPKTQKTAGDFLFGLDVRGLRADEAVYKVMKYIDEAIVAGANEIKILHGTGNGILRKVIRDYLRTQPIVKRFGDERIELGGAGITIVELDY